MGREGENKFGQILSEYRAGAGVTKEVLAERIGVAPKYIANVETGVRRPPRRDLVKRVAKKLNLDKQQLNRLFKAADYAPWGPWDDEAAMDEALILLELTRH